MFGLILKTLIDAVTQTATDDLAGSQRGPDHTIGVPQYPVDGYPRQAGSAMVCTMAGGALVHTVSPDKVLVVEIT
jgi:hypothetical protein